VSPRRGLQSSLTHQLDVCQAQYATVEEQTLPFLVLGCETVCYQTLSRATHSHGSVENSEHICSDNLTPILFDFSVVMVLAVFT